MELLTYSSNENSQINNARRNYWVSRHMLGQCNTHPFSRSMWMGAVNRDRAALRKLAHKIRAKLPAQEVYRVELKGEAIRFAEYVYAHSQAQANRRVQAKYGDLFEVVHHV